MRTNILLATRSITKNKISSVITVVGLSIAFCCLLLIYLYVSQEYTYNSFHENKDRVFRINYSIENVDGTKRSTALFDPKLSELIKGKIPHVKRSTAFRSAQKPTMKFENQNFEENLCITEPDFFSMFSFKFLIGEKENIFKNPNEILITKKLADKFQAIASCSKEALIGKPVFFKEIENQAFIISGIMEDVPKNSSIQFNALIPYKYEDAFRKSNNVFGNSSIFYEVDRNDNIQLAEKQIISTINEYYVNQIKELQEQKILVNNKGCFKPEILSIKDVYLSDFETDYELKNNKTSLYVLSLIGFLILIIACINFILLSLGQSFKKVGEIGVRRAIGAKGGDIFSIFFTENLILTLSAFVFGTILCYFLTPVFKQLAQNGIYFELINIPLILLFVASSILFIVILTSIIPALKLIKIKPNLKTSKGLNVNKKSRFSSLFVTLQYGLSVILIIVTLAIVLQTNYMKNKNLGFSTENILDLRIYHLEKSEKLALKDQLKNQPGIKSFTLTDRDYTGGRGNNRIKNNQGEFIESRILNVDENYIPTLGLKIIQGENFTETKTGEKSVIINEKLSASLNLKNDAVGQSINMDGIDYRIAGIVKDFHYDSMKEKILPLMLFSRTDNGEKGNFIFLKYYPAQLDRLIPFIRKTWEKIAPKKELDFKFWDEQLNQRYASEERWSQIIGYATIIAVITSSLGLFGLTILIINSRTKEIGIRKVNGAKVNEVMTMLNKDYLMWVAIAFVIACPIAWYAMHKWLENFAYKIELSWWIFALAGLLALVVALLTVSWQSWRAATRNPVEALRYE